MIGKNKSSRLNILFLVIFCLLSSARGAIELPSCEYKENECEFDNKLTECNGDVEFEIRSYCIFKSTIHGYNSDRTRICKSKSELGRGFNVVIIDNNSINAFPSVQEVKKKLKTNPNISNIALVNCESDDYCKQTTGIIKYIDDQYYNIYDKKDKNNGKADISKNKCTSNVGGLATIDQVVVLCVTQYNYIHLSAYAAYYLMEGNTVAGSPFTYEENAVIRIDAESFVFSNYFPGNKTSEFYLSSMNNKLLSNLVGITSNTEFNSIENRKYHCKDGSCSYDDLVFTNKGKFMMYNKLYEVNVDEENGNIVFKDYIKNGIMGIKTISTNITDITGVLLVQNDLKGELLNDVAEIKLYDCILGECIQTHGYIKVKGKENVSKIYECQDNGSCNKEQTQDTITCDSTNSGKAYIDSDSYKICINEDTDYKGVEIKKIDSGNLPIYYSTISPQSYNLYISDEYGYIVGSAIKADYYGHLKQGKKTEYELLIRNSNNNFLLNDFNTNIRGYTFNFADKDSSELFYCKEEKVTKEIGGKEVQVSETSCEIVEKDGYFGNSLKKYVIKCEKKSESSICNYSNEGSSCDNDNNNNGKAILYYDKNFKYGYCNESNKVDFSETVQYYPIYNFNAESKYPTIKPGEDTIVIRVDQYSATQYTKEKCNFKSLPKKEDCNGYYLDDDGSLYKCSIIENNINCEKQTDPKGYFKVTDVLEIEDKPYISCDGEQCKSMTVPTATTCDKPGSLVYNLSEVMLCLDSSSMVGFSKSEEVFSYVIKENGNTLLAYSGVDDVLITITETAMISNDITKLGAYVTNPYKSVYETIKSEESTYTIEEKTEKLLTVSAFIFENNMGYGKLVDEGAEIEETEDKIELYHCKVSSCIRTKGYIKFKNNKISMCDTNNNCIIQENALCNPDSPGSEGIAYKEEDKFKICLNGSGIDIESSKEYISNKGTDNRNSCSGSNNAVYNLLISNKKGNIIILSKQVGYYYYMDTGSDTPEKDDDDTYRLLKCYSTGDCYKFSGYGYYITTDEKFDEKFVFCDGSTCKEKEKLNGYYSNSDYDSIVCFDEKCNITERKEECEENSNDIILNKNGKLSYCKGNDEIEFLTKIQYYNFTNIDAKSSKYPLTIEPGSDFILLKIGEYKVTQYVDKENEICIDGKTNFVDEGCLKTGSIKYECKNADESCKNDVNECDPTKKDNLNICKGYYLTSDNKLYKCEEEEVVGTAALDKVVVEPEFQDGPTIEHNIIKREDQNAPTVKTQIVCNNISAEARGYYKVEDPYEITKVAPFIRCDHEGCTPESYPTEPVDGCGSENFGELVLDSATNEVKLCADSENYVGFNNSKTKYGILVNIDYENSPFTEKEEEKVIIEIGFDYMKSIGIGGIKPSGVYLINNMVYAYEETLEKKPSTGMMAFYFGDDDVYGTLVKSYVDDEKKSLSNKIENIRIYSCVEGNCELSTFGFLKYSTIEEDKTVYKVVECDSAGCSKDKLVTKNDIDCDTDLTDYKFAYYDENKFKFCNKAVVTNSREKKEISNGSSETFIISYSKEIYIADKGGNIIGKSTNRGGFFLRGNYALQCNDGKCEEIKDKGYYINSESNDVKDIIFCYGLPLSTCKNNPVVDGFYVNEYEIKQYNGVKCVGSKCSLFKVGLSCDKHENGIIYSGNNGSGEMYKYCNGNKPEHLYVKKVYPISDVNAESSYYPQIESGNDIILIETTSNQGGYSLKQRITDNEGICIDKENNEVTCGIGMTKYICTQKRKGCVVEKIYCDPTAESPDKDCSGYYLVEDGSGNDKKNVLYQCESSNGISKCNAQSDVTGYFGVSDGYEIEIKKYKYIVCDGGECKKLFVKNLGTECKNIGDLIIDEETDETVKNLKEDEGDEKLINEKIYFCKSLNKKESVQWIGDSNIDKKEMVEFDINENIFTKEENKTLVVDIINKNELLYIKASDLSELKTNIYLINKSNANYVYLFMNNGNGKYSFEKLETTDVLAFRCYNEPLLGVNPTLSIQGILVRNEEYLGSIINENLININTYICKKGKCNLSNGNINYNEKIIYDIKRKVEITGNECKNKGDEGKFYVDSDGVFRLCQGGLKDDEINEFDIANNVSSGGSLNYVISKSNRSTDPYNIFLYDRSGHLITYGGNDGYYLYDFYGDGKKYLFKCEKEGNCNKIEGEGYYLDAASAQTNNLIYCEKDEKSKLSTCEIVTKDDGYFYNSEVEVEYIICSSSKCEAIDTVETRNDNPCVGNKYKLVKKKVGDSTDYIRFCSDESNYSQLNDRIWSKSASGVGEFSSSSIIKIIANAKYEEFPKFENGTDEMLFRKYNFSITQYITDSKGIYLYCNPENGICNDGGFEIFEGKDIYVCDEKFKGCVVTPNICDPVNSKGGCINEGLLVDGSYYLVGSSLYKCHVDIVCENVVADCSVQPPTKGFYKVTNRHHAKNVPYIKCDGSTCTKLELPDRFIECDGTKCIRKDASTDEDYNDEDFDGEYKFEDKVNYNCNAENAEKVIISEKEKDYVLCLNMKEYVKFDNESKDNGKLYILEINYLSVFAQSTSDKVALIEKGSNYVKLADISKYESNTYLIDYYESVSKNDDKEKYYCPFSIKNNGNGNVVLEEIMTNQMMAFNYTDNEELKLDFVALTDMDYQTDIGKYIDNVYLFDCHFGKCAYTTYGFLKYRNGDDIIVAKYSETGWEKRGQYITGIEMKNGNVEKSPCDSGNGKGIIENAYYNVEKSKFMVCVETENGKYKEKTINSDNSKANFIFNIKNKSYYPPLYNIFISDIGGNIIGKSSYGFDEMSSYYLSKVYGEEIVMMKCTRGSSDPDYASCSKYWHNYGENFLNHGNSGNNLITCNEKCKAMQVNEGYYWNDKYEFIECDSSKCYPYSLIEAQSCENYPYEIIKKDKEYREYSYCNGKTGIVISNIDADDEYMYQFSKVSTSRSNYPGIKDSNEKIIINLKEYAIGQYTNTTFGVCVDNSNDKVTPEICPDNGMMLTSTYYLWENGEKSYEYIKYKVGDSRIKTELIEDSRLLKQKSGAISNVKINMISIAFKIFIITVFLTFMFI